MISHSSEFLVASSDTGRGEAFCWDDRIELDWSGALLDLLLILESFLLSPLGCPHESHALKAPLPFFFSSIIPPIFFQEAVLVLDYSLDYSLVLFLCDGILSSFYRS